MPKSRGRKPKKNGRRSRPTRPNVRVRPTYQPGRLRLDDDIVGALLLSGKASPEQMVVTLLPYLWLNKMSGHRSNVCVDGCLTLRYAYEQFGIRAEVRPVDLAIRDASGTTVLYGQPEPHWDDDDNFHGHCVLWLPDTNRLVDATVEQYPEVRRYRLGPIIGAAAGVMQGTLETREALANGVLLPGTHIGVQRKDLTLLYVAVDAEYQNVVRDHPLIRRYADQHRRAGINLASWALDMLRLPEIIDRARQAPYPRLQALLAAVGDAPSDPVPKGDYLFQHTDHDGTKRWLRLDEIPLPSPSPVSDLAAVREILDSVDTEARTVFVDDPSVRLTDLVAADLALEGLPVALFEPPQGVRAVAPGGRTRELQAEAIIGAGFTRLLSKIDTPLNHLPAWTVRRTATGLELWDAGGIWARATLAPDPRWLAAAAQTQRVLVIYGVQVGVRTPEQPHPRTDADRAAELDHSRQAGIAAAAVVTWHDTTSRQGAASEALGRIRRKLARRNITGG